MSSPSLTVQAGLLMVGRFLSMPLAFLVPIILVRQFSLEEFGYYKQLFLVFNVLLPVIDFGITNSLYYFIPRYSESKNSFIGQTLIITSFFCVFSLFFFFCFSSEIALVFTNEEHIGKLIPLLGVFAVSWHLSTIFEVVLIVEKKALGAGILTFLSESARSVVAIVVVLAGYGLKELLYAFVAIGGFRCLLMSYYLLKNYAIDWHLSYVSIKRQLAYSIPFGAAVIVNSLVGNVHQYVVSVTSNAADFALFAVGCFQLPLLMVVVDSIAKTSLVRMAELRNHDDAYLKIGQLVSNSCRKLWLLFFPVFVFLFIVAEEFIEILFTDQYLGSVPTFRIFILVIPLSAILIQHVPRALEQTNFILINNTFVLALAIVLCWVGARLFGIEGVALGFVVSQLAWKGSFLLKCRQVLQLDMRELLPFRVMSRSAGIFIIGGGVAYLLKMIGGENVFLTFSIAFGSYSLFCLIAYRYFGLLLDDEKKEVLRLVLKIRKYI